MYKFILNMWVMGNVDVATVSGYVPMWIDQDQAGAILATPQVNTQ
jgi:hypothetical protein